YDRVTGVQTCSLPIFEDCAGIVSVAGLNTIIAVTQEIRAKRAMDKVNMLIVREVTVIRDSQEQQVGHADIVLGDLILLRRGDQEDRKSGEEGMGVEIE